MTFKAVSERERKQKSRGKIALSSVTQMFISFALTTLILAPQPGSTEENKQKNSLPPAPDTGSPQEESSAGGTRDNRQQNDLCGAKNEEIVYLLGEQNREHTLADHPTFWFHLPQNLRKIAQMKFVVKELETGRQIYDRTIEEIKPAGIIGIALPQKQKYALSPQTNYTWSLEVECDRTNKESEVALSGWISQKPANPKLQQNLATASKLEKHSVYFQHGFLYDALTELAQLKVARPTDNRINTAWNQLLTDLGWQELTQQQSAIEPTLLDFRGL